MHIEIVTVGQHLSYTNKDNDIWGATLSFHDVILSRSRGEMDITVVFGTIVGGSNPFESTNY